MPYSTTQIINQIKNKALNPTYTPLGVLPFIASNLEIKITKLNFFKE